jgi:hypothetical protein
MRMRIGEYLVSRGVLTSRQVDEVLAYQKTCGLRFGEAAIKLRMLTEDKLRIALGKNYRIDFFHADPLYLPVEGRELYSREDVVRYGLIPMGFRMEHKFFRARRMLNVGFVDPSRLEALDRADALAREKLGNGGIHGVRAWLVMPEHFWNTITQLYNVTPEWVLALGEGKVDPTLLQYVQQLTQKQRDAKSQASQRAA